MGLTEPCMAAVTHSCVNRWLRAHCKAPRSTVKVLECAILMGPFTRAEWQRNLQQFYSQDQSHLERLIDSSYVKSSSPASWRSTAQQMPTTANFWQPITWSRDTGGSTLVLTHQTGNQLLQWLQKKVLSKAHHWTLTDMVCLRRFFLWLGSFA